MTDGGQTSLRVNAGVVLRIVLTVVTSLAILGVAAVVVRYTDSLQGAFPGDQILQQQFILDQEGNIPTWFSSALLLLAAAEATFLGVFEPSVDRAHRRRWLGLGAIFAVMSIDEMASLHETFSSMIRDALGLGGIFYFAWVIPAMLLVAVVAVSYLRFVANLPPRVRSALIVGGVVFVAGAVGMELVGGTLADGVGQETMAYGFVTTAEELLEMVGLALLTYALLLHIAGRGPYAIVVEGSGDQRVG